MQRGLLVSKSSNYEAPRESACSYITVQLLLRRVQDAPVRALALLLPCRQQVSVLHQGLPGQQLLFLDLGEFIL